MCTELEHGLSETLPPCSLDRTSMDINSSEILASTGSPHNGTVRLWRESVSSGMRTVEAVIRELSQNDVPVLVVAEPGSGKQAAAARIHALSSRASEPARRTQAAPPSLQKDSPAIGSADTAAGTPSEVTSATLTAASGVPAA